MTTRKALLIGVPEYDSTDIGNLSFVRQDMEAVQAALESSDYQVEAIGADSKVGVSPNTLRRYIKQFCREASADDTLLLYFIGHGLHYRGKDYLVPKDAYFDVEPIEPFLFPVDLTEIINEADCPAKAIFFVIDACRKGLTWVEEDTASQKAEPPHVDGPSNETADHLQTFFETQFDPESLICLCYDQVDYHPVYADFQSQLDKDEMIDQIVSYVPLENLQGLISDFVTSKAVSQNPNETKRSSGEQVSYAQHWGEGVISESNKIVYIFANQPGQTSQSIENGRSFSLFSQAFSEVIKADYAATTVQAVIDGVQQQMIALSATHDVWKQKITLKTNMDDAASYHIANGPDHKQGKQIEDNIWVRKAMDNGLWEADGVAGETSAHDLKEAVKSLTIACRAELEASNEAIPHNIWRDEHFPVRVIERLEFLITHSASSLTLSPAEAALLIISPFLLEAVFANALIAAAQDNPLDMKETGDTSGIRGALEKTYQSRPDLVRRAKQLLDQQKKEEHDALALWLLYRTLLRMPEVWQPSNEGGYISETLIDALAHPKSICRYSSSKETLTQSRLLELAHYVYTDPERIDRLNILQVTVNLAPGMWHEQHIREKLLAYLLMLAGRMAIDVRQHSEILVDHIGLSDSFALSEIIQSAADAQWLPDAQGRSLQVICSHPALHIAFQQYTQKANTILERLQRKVHEKEDGLEVLDKLPYHFSDHNIQALEFENGKPAYEKPLLHFQLAQNQVREILMGEHLYGEPNLAIRELYQNALDACRYRLVRTTYLNRVNEHNQIEWEGHIVFRQGVADGRPYIECEDNGIGMGWRELTDAFSQAGRRFADMPEFIEEQAEWYQFDPELKLYPNSQFGVGVFSYFMIADELEIETCRLDREGASSGQTFQVQIAGSGSLFRVNTSSTQREAGTRIRLYLNQTEGKGRVSCLDTLKELLWIAQFKTEARQG
ncbi:MAG: caspase family protein, partial [Chloroflexota bacterium]